MEEGDCVIRCGLGDATSSDDCDIGKLLNSGVDIKSLTRDHKYRILTTNPNTDPESYPGTRPCPSSNFRQFKPEWLRSYPWMHYSQCSDGVYCRACVLFSPYQVGGERSFSQLKLIKTARRATMSESRLGSLALMKINRDRCNQLLSAENMKKLVVSYSQLHPRRMKLPFMLPYD